MACTPLGYMLVMLTMVCWPHLALRPQVDPAMARLEVTEDRIRPKPPFSIALKGTDVCVPRKSYPSIRVADPNMYGWRATIERVKAKDMTKRPQKADHKKDWVRAHRSRRSTHRPAPAAPRTHRLAHALIFTPLSSRPYEYRHAAPPHTWQVWIDGRWLDYDLTPITGIDIDSEEEEEEEEDDEAAVDDDEEEDDEDDSDDKDDGDSEWQQKRRRR